DGKIGTIFVSGSLIGASAANSGTILSTGDMGAVRVNGDLVGAGGNESGEIRTSGKITGGLINGVFVGVTVGGSVIGGAGMQSGRIRANGDLPAIRIGRDLLGGSNSAAGQIQSVGGTIASVTVGGSLVGGSGLETGSLVSGSNIGPVRINGSMEGGAGVHSGGINLDTQGNSTSVTIGGSIRSGSGALSGCICVNGVLGPVKVLGSLVGTVARPVVISGLGHLVLPATATTDVGIKSLTVGGRVEFAQILAGYQTDSSTVLTPANADAQIGAVVVGGDWIASSIGAGVIDGGNGFGNSGDAKITDPNDAPNIISKIGSINIAGEVMGTVGGADHFGFVAEQISSLMVGGQTIALTANKDVVNVGTTGDVALQEI
ncbi:MAG TPA: hypothetical protein VKD71_05465, partial [Gemmataceae bacterium]|nr:hypothetical protein [Gemmataceae bacterium]